MPKVYTESEIKTLVLDQINSIKKLADINIVFSTNDSTQAYEEAVRECGFTVPTATDSDIDVKNTWLINRQRRWYYDRIREKLSLMIETADLRGGGIVERLTKIIDKMDADFQNAKESAELAHLFINPDIVSDSSTLIQSGFINDRVGQDITKYS